MSDSSTSDRSTTTTVTEFVAACLNRQSQENRPLPIVLLLGRQGAGKTRLLDQLRTELADLRPLARLDLGGCRADPVSVLTSLVFQLHPPVKFVGTITFPLFSLGVLALSLNPGSNLDARRDRLERLLAGRGGADTITGQLKPALNELTSALPEAARPLADDPSALMAKWLSPFAKAKRRGRLLDWYAEQGTQPGEDGRNLLYRLCEWRRDEERTARRVGRVLCAAFLADLRACFEESRVTRPWKPLTNCLLLLDNTGSEAGTRFLETLASCRAEQPDTTDPLVVVAAHETAVDDSLGTGSAYRAVVRVAGTPDATVWGPDYATWMADTRRLPVRALWYPVSLGDLDEHGIQQIVSSGALDGRPRHDADFIRDLTGGHLGSTDRLAAVLAAAEDRPGEFQPRGLLDDHDEMLRQLLPGRLDDELLRDMAVCAATPHLSAPACTAALRQVRGTEDATENVRRIHRLLTETLWATRKTDDSLDLHPLPRRLLLARLAGDLHEWDRVHEAFESYYLERARDAQATGTTLDSQSLPVIPDVADDDDMLYHVLARVRPVGASGEASASQMNMVSTSMSERLRSVPPGQWCEELDRICAAPNSLGAGHDPRAVVRGLAGSHAGNGPDRRVSVARIIIGHWLYNDRLVDPRHELADLLASEYQNLASHVGIRGDEFGRRSQKYGDIARQWGWRR